MGIIPNIDIYSDDLSLTEKAYYHIKKKILSCEFMPGEDIYEKQFFEELDYGRTPIREALIALKNENLIEIFPRKGMRVKPFSKKYINEMYQIRKIIEPSIAIQFKSLYSKGILLDFEKKFMESMNSTDEEYYSLDIDFHMYFIEITQNDTLMKFYEQLLTEQYRLAVYASKLEFTTKNPSEPQHKAIIDAMLTEDDRSIQETITFHLNHSLITSLKSLEV